MAHFAKVENNQVVQVLVVEPEFVATGALGDPRMWIQTSYNTHGNQHRQGGTPLRGNFAGIGFTYDPEHDVFYAPQPYPSWVLDAATWLWNPPVAYPTDGARYLWDENTQNWQAI